MRISVGLKHFLLVTENGEIYSWGWGRHGQLGHGNNADQLYPKLIAGISNLKDDKVISVAAGTTISLFLTKNGKVYFAGRQGRLSSPDSLLIPADIKFVQIVVVNNIPCFLSSDAQFFMLLETSLSQIILHEEKIGKIISVMRGPEDLAILTDRKRIYSLSPGQKPILLKFGGLKSFFPIDNGHLVLTDNGDVFVYGAGKYQALRINEKIIFMTHEGINRYPFLLGKSGSVYHVKKFYRSFFAPRISFPGRVVEISAGSEHGLCVTDEGKIYFLGEIERQNSEYKNCSSISVYAELRGIRLKASCILPDYNSNLLKAKETYRGSNVIIKTVY